MSVIVTFFVYKKVWNFRQPTSLTALFRVEFLQRTSVGSPLTGSARAHCPQNCGLSVIVVSSVRIVCVRFRPLGTAPARKPISSDRQLDGSRIATVRSTAASGRLSQHKLPCSMFCQLSLFCHYEKVGKEHQPPYVYRSKTTVQVALVFIPNCRQKVDCYTTFSHYTVPLRKTKLFELPNFHFFIILLNFLSIITHTVTLKPYSSGASATPPACELAQCLCRSRVSSATTRVSGVRCT